MSELKKFTATLQFEFDLYGEHEGVTLESIQEVANCALSNWNDGRYDFFSELISHGLQTILEGAIQNSLREHFRQKYPGEFVADGNIQMGRYVVEADAVKNAVLVGVRNDAMKMEILPPRLQRGDRAREFLAEVLASGPVEQTKIQEQAEANAIAYRTVERAKKQLGVLSKRNGFGQGSVVYWMLPKD